MASAERSAPADSVTAAEPSAPPATVLSRPAEPPEPPPAPADAPTPGSEPTPDAELNPELSPELNPEPALGAEARRLAAASRPTPAPSKPQVGKPIAPALETELAPTPAEPLNADHADQPERAGRTADDLKDDVTAPAGEASPTTRSVDAWGKLVADPAHAPELLALAAVQSIGPRAREWVARAQRDYPTADRAALARLATSQFSRAGSLGSVFGAVAGSYAPVVLAGTAAVAHAELILHVAAAYGRDPAAPERAVDLLVLTRVHLDREAAEAAVAAARRPAYDEDGGGVRAGVWRLSRLISGQVSGWGVFRLVNRYLPGVSLLATFLGSRAATDSLAARANAFYRNE